MNVDGHCTFSGSLVVVVVPDVSSVDRDEVPRRGMVFFAEYSNTNVKHKKKAVVRISVDGFKAARIALCKIREMRLSRVASRVGPMT